MQRGRESMRSQGSELYRASSVSKKRARTSARHRLVAFCVVAASMLTANCAHPFVHRHMLSTKPQGENASGSSNLRSQDQASRKVPAEQDVPNSSRQEQLPEILAQHESSSAVEQWQILVNASDQDVSQLPSPQELFQSSRSVYIPPEYASKVRDLSKGNEEAIKEAEEGRLEAPVGVRNTTISDPSKWAGWQAEEDRGEYDFGGNLGESSEQDKEDGKVYVMKQLAQSSYGGRRGKGWKVEEHAPQQIGAALSWFRNNVQSLDIKGMTDMVTSKGYPSETHKCVTRDGHHLVNFRIKYGADGSNGRKKPGNGVERQPILLIHGISLSSTSWVVNGPKESLGFILADRGYDVWMMNTRGNTYSREHEDFQDSDPRFWAWSMDEMALEDVPAVVAYVLGVTGAKKVPVIGHSQGGTLAIAALAELPRMNEAVSLLVGLGPVVYSKYMTAPGLVQFSARANDSIIYSLLPPQEWIFMSETAHTIYLSNLCQLPPSIPACLVTTAQMFGTSDHISVLQYRRMWQQWPSPTSYYNVLHWAQMYNAPKPRFMKFNYGPEYDLQKIKSPVYYISGGKDVLAEKEDTALARKQLSKGGSLVGSHHIDSYSHMDFIWNPYAQNDLHKPILDSLSKYAQDGE